MSQAINHRPGFLITVDTEGGQVWSGLRRIETRSAACVPRLQVLSERHGFKLTCSTDYEM